LDAVISFGIITFITTLFYTVLAMASAQMDPKALDAIKAGKTGLAIRLMATAFTVVSPILFPLWFIVIFVVGWKMSFGIFDAFARGQADMIFNGIPGARKLGMRKIYYLWILIVTLVGIGVTLLGSPRGPIYILNVLAFMSPFIMGAYCVLLVYVNNFLVPKELKMSLFSTAVLSGGAVFYLGALFYSLVIFGAIPTG